MFQDKWFCEKLLILFLCHITDIRFSLLGKGRFIGGKRPFLFREKGFSLVWNKVF